MPRLNQVVTRTGDNGQTGLGDGSRVDKHHPLIELIGTIDELNSQLGIVLAYLKQDGQNAAPIGTMLTIQHQLFDMGGELSIPGSVLVTADKLAWLETQTSDINAALTPLEEFVLPGGTLAAAHCHSARTIARRAERQYWQLLDSGAEHSINETTGKYLNRLSDFLFVMARYINLKGKENDVLWNNLANDRQR